jgi:hypothetical protein
VNPYGPALRAIAITARTTHLGAMAMYLGGRAFGASESATRRWRWATTVTGATLLATEIAHSPDNWPHQSRGILTMTHVGILPAGHLAPSMSLPVAVAALVLGAIGSHLPRSIRRWSVLRRQVLP